MPIDLLHEQCISLADARRQLIPQFNKKPVSPPTLYRWINVGVLTGDGSRLRLEAVRCGKYLVTTEEAVHRFFDELTRRSNVRPATEKKLAVEIEAELHTTGLLPTG